MSGPPVLRGRLMTLRPLRDSDKIDRFSCGRNADYVRMMGGDYRHMPPLTQDEVDQWYGRMAAEPCCWAIDAGGLCVGTARLHSLDEGQRRARYAIGIFNPGAWGGGIGTEATRRALRFAFDELGLHRVDLRVLAYNERAIACYEKCAFVIEGVERESVRVADEWQDDVIMSVLEDDYRKAAKRWKL